MFTACNGITVSLTGNIGTLVFYAGPTQNVTIKIVIFLKEPRLCFKLYKEQVYNSLDAFKT